MRSTASRRPSPSLVISFIALFVALSGTALALSKGSVKSKHIARGAVKTSDIARNAVDSARVADDSITGADVNEGSLNLPTPPGQPAELPPSGPAGGDLTGSYPNPTIAPSAVGSAEVSLNSLTSADLAGNSVSNVEIAPDAVGPTEVIANAISSDELVSIVEQQSTTSLGGGGNATLTAPCGASEQLISGGFSTGTGGAVKVNQSRRVGNGWSAHFLNTSGTTQGVFVFAYCLAAN